MGLLDKILRKNSAPQQSGVGSEHAIIVRFSYGSTDLSRLFALEERLEKAIADTQVGEYDGNDVATDGSDGVLYMYGPDADALLSSVRPTLEEADFIQGAQVTLRYGPPADGVREVELVLGI